MIDWSKPIDKTDPKVLAEWASELRQRVIEDRRTGYCEAQDWIERLCAEADAARGRGDIDSANKALDQAAYYWYMLNR